MRRATLIALVLAAALAVPASAAAQFGIAPDSLSVTAKNADGTIDTQASDHPYSYTVSFALNTDGEGHSVGGELRALLIDLPPGLVGNPTALPQCPRSDFEGSAPRCSPNTQIGVVRANLPGIGLASGPIYNLAPPPGIAAQLGFSAAGLNVLQNASVRSAEGYGLRVAATSIPLEVTSIDATIWGTPGDASHDFQRGAQAAAGHGGSVGFVGPHLPFLTLPATCGAPLETTVYVDSKLNPGQFVPAEAKSLDAGGDPAALLGCGAVPFSPQADAALSSSQAQSPTGLGFRLALPNEGLLNPGGIAETEPVKTVVTLPRGIVANPAAAAGLGSCTQAQFAVASAADPGCPSSAKLGTLYARTPLLEEPIEGSVYLATPHQNPFGTLVALYIVATVPGRGVVVKQAGRVDVDPVSGQLTTTFDGLPPIPYSSFELSLREGPRAALTTPQLCGRYEAVARLYPFSAPAAATVRTAPFTITSGAGGRGCAPSEAALPNAPGFDAGTLTPLAGTYSPFVFRLARSDGDQPFGSITAALPEGLVGKLAGIPYCSEAQIAAAAARSGEGQGALEAAAPSCPAASRIGTVDVGAGAGSSPIHVAGNAYLAGPYKGAPLSIAIITPAITGPFDLGTVVVRTALQVDPETAQITAVSDPLPQILDGIPLSIRSVTLSMDRADFTLNPTSCAQKQIAGSETSALGSVASLAQRFQVGGCGALDFKPKVRLALKGGTRRTKHPKLHAVLKFPQDSEANLRSFSLTLPHSQFIDQRRVNNPCIRPRFAAGTCPKKSVLGHAKAYSPLLDKPLKGKVYFRSNGGARELPDLVLDLHGQVDVVSVAYVDSVVKKGTENSRIRTRALNVPDAPLSRVVIDLKGGKDGVLQNSQNLCASKQSAAVQMQAQNDKTARFSARIATSCKHNKKKKRKRARHQRSR